MRRLAVKNLQENRVGNALAWAVKSKDGEMSKCIVDKLLDNLVETGTLECKDIIDYLGCEVLISGGKLNRSFVQNCIEKILIENSK